MTVPENGTTGILFHSMPGLGNFPADDLTVVKWRVYYHLHKQNIPMV
jgi:hypothetical protein